MTELLSLFQQPATYVGAIFVLSVLLIKKLSRASLESGLQRNRIFIMVMVLILISSAMILLFRQQSDASTVTASAAKDSTSLDSKTAVLDTAKNAVPDKIYVDTPTPVTKKEGRNNIKIENTNGDVVFGDKITID